MFFTFKILLLYGIHIKTGEGEDFWDLIILHCNNNMVLYRFLFFNFLDMLEVWIVKCFNFLLGKEYEPCIYQIHKVLLKQLLYTDSRNLYRSKLPGLTPNEGCLSQLVYNFVVHSQSWLNFYTKF